MVFYKLKMCLSISKKMILKITWENISVRRQPKNLNKYDEKYPWESPREIDFKSFTTESVVTGQEVMCTFCLERQQLFNPWALLLMPLGLLIDAVFRNDKLFLDKNDNTWVRQKSSLFIGDTIIASWLFIRASKLC